MNSSNSSQFFKQNIHPPVYTSLVKLSNFCGWQVPTQAYILLRRTVITQQSLLGQGQNKIECQRSLDKKTKETAAEVSQRLPPYGGIFFLWVAHERSITLWPKIYTFWLCIWSAGWLEVGLGGRDCCNYVQVVSGAEPITDAGSL